MRDCKYCAKWEVCPFGKKGHDNGSSIGYSAGECTDYYYSDDKVYYRDYEITKCKQEEKINDD